VPRLGLNTLADLGASHAIYADCDACSRSIRLDAARLGAVHGPQLSIAELKHRLTCRNCGARPRQIRIVYVVPSRRR